ATLARVKKAARMASLRVLFVSVDPQRDTPALLERYVHAFDPKFKGVTGTQTALDELTRTFGVAVNRVQLPGGDYTVDHSAAVFWVDGRAPLPGVSTPPFDAQRLAADLRRLAAAL